MDVTPRKKICVYCSSSDAVDKVFFDVAEKMGELIAKKGYDLVYGGGGIGLMGRLARSVQKHKGSVFAVIPEKLNLHGIVFPDAEELVVTRDLRERKAVMEDRSSAFIALPGGIGTLEEISEILTLKQLNYHTKPVILVNTANFYGPLLDLLDSMEKNKFVKPDNRKLYFVAKDPSEAMEHIANYQPPKIENKWFKLQK